MTFHCCILTRHIHGSHFYMKLLPIKLYVGILIRGHSCAYFMMFSKKTHLKILNQGTYSFSYIINQLSHIPQSKEAGIRTLVALDDQGGESILTIMP